jgi:hypothetical protein
LQSIQDSVFTPICKRCHVGVSAPQGCAAFEYEIDVSLVNGANIVLERIDMSRTTAMRQLPARAGLATGNPIVQAILPRVALGLMSCERARHSRRCSRGF